MTRWSGSSSTSSCAGDDEELRAGSLRTLRRGVSDLEMLLPEPPSPPAPAARLSRGARARAEEWPRSATAELDGLRGSPAR